MKFKEIIPHNNHLLAIDFSHNLWLLRYEYNGNVCKASAVLVEIFERTVNDKDIAPINLHKSPRS